MLCRYPSPHYLLPIQVQPHIPLRVTGAQNLLRSLWLKMEELIVSAISGFLFYFLCKDHPAFKTPAFMRHGGL